MRNMRQHVEETERDAVLVEDAAWIRVMGTPILEALEDLFYYLRLTERETVVQRDKFEDVLHDMKEDGFSIRPVDDAFARFTEKRAKYAPRLDAIAVLLAAPPVNGSATAPSSGRERHNDARRPPLSACTTAPSTSDLVNLIREGLTTAGVSRSS
jgi:hypothetical protein